MDAHRRDDEGAVTVLRAVRSEWLIGGSLALAFLAGGNILLLRELATKVERAEVKQDQRWTQIEDSQRRTNNDLQVQKVEFAEFKGEVRALLTRRTPTPTQ